MFIYTEDMKRLFILTAILISTATNAQAIKFSKSQEEKTVQLAENFVKYSKEGDYNKTYKVLRQIQKYEYRLDKTQLVSFYSDLHEAVADACNKYGITPAGKAEMTNIVNALFSKELKNAVNEQ